MRSYSGTFVPQSILDAKMGHRPSFKAILDAVDLDAPEWPAVASVLREMVSAGVEIDEAAAAMAGKIGALRYADRQRSSVNKGRPVRTPSSLTAGCGSVVYYVRRASLIKIGTTTNPALRFADLLPDEIYAVEPGGQPEEHQRHVQFTHLRRGREYFEMADELMQHVAFTRKLHGDPDPSWPTWATVLSASPPDGATSTPELITALEAERRYGIKAVTVRSYARKGKIRRAGRDGREGLFFADEIASRVPA